MSERFMDVWKMFVAFGKFRKCVYATFWESLQRDEDVEGRKKRLSIEMLNEWSGPSYGTGVIRVGERIFVTLIFKFLPLGVHERVWRVGCVDFSKFFTIFADKFRSLR